MDQFDPYHKWLGIPRSEQPANHYRLLGITLFESDPDVIEAAADRQMTYVSQCATGTHSKVSQQLLNELSAARVCLLVVARKQAYDAALRVKLDQTRLIEESLIPVPLTEPEPSVALNPFAFTPQPRTRKTASGKRRSKPAQTSANRPFPVWGIAALVVGVLALGLGLGLMFRGRTAETTRPRDNTSVPAIAVVNPPLTLSTEPKEATPKSTEAVVAPAVEVSSPIIATDGDANGALIIGSDPFSPTEAFTIEFWVSTDAVKGTLISKRHSEEDATFLVHLDNGVPNLSISIGNGERGSGGGPTINDGKWHHIAVVRRGTELTLFVDGKQTVRTDEQDPLASRSPWKFGTSYQRVAGAARFGGLRISKSVRYDGSFVPQKQYAKDQDTLLPE